MDKFGYLARDKVTGFEGIITAKHIYIYGCVQYVLTPRIDDNQYQRPLPFDEHRLEILNKRINPEDVKNPLLKEPEENTIPEKKIFILWNKSETAFFGIFSKREFAEEKARSINYETEIGEYPIGK